MDRSTSQPSAHPLPEHLAEPPFPSAQASAEGWDVFDCDQRSDGTPRIELQRIDAPEDHDPLFPDDHAAWDHVVARARAGSALHQHALRMVDPVERSLIEARCGSWPECGR